MLRLLGKAKKKIHVSLIKLGNIQIDVNAQFGKVLAVVVVRHIHHVIFFAFLGELMSLNCLMHVMLVGVLCFFRCYPQD